MSDIWSCPECGCWHRVIRSKGPTITGFYCIECEYKEGKL